MTELCIQRPTALAALLLLATGAFACKPAAAPPSEAAATPSPAAAESALRAQADKAATVITPDVIRAPIAELGSDAYEGRDPGSNGDVKARDYLVQQMQGLGLEPGFADGAWQQSFELVSVDAAMPPTWSFTGTGGKSTAFKRKDEFIAASGVQDPKAAVKDAEVVFVGYGIQAPEYQWDDFKGQDLKGKVLLMLNNDPDWDDNLFAGKRRLYYGRWTYKYESAARQGAAGAIIIHTDDSAGYPFQVVQTSWTGEQFELPREDEPRIQVRGWLTHDASARLAELGGKKLDELVEAAKSRNFAPVPLGVRTSLSLANKIRRVQTANVVGKITGRDPQLSQQWVIFTAHHDHLGIGEPDATGDRIYNGARDNASGCAEILAIAKAFKALPEAPRRTVAIAFVAAEEQGLLGSKYLAEHPPVPAGRIAADINFDSANIWGKTKDVTYIGIEKSPLGEVVRRFAGEQGREVKGDQFPDKGFYYRSDQFSFAKVGVPAIYLEPGTDFEGRPEGWGKEQMEKNENESYHQPSDELQPDWNFDGAVQDSVLGFKAGLWIAEQDEMPTWTPGDEFEAARQQAIRYAVGAAAAPSASPAPSPAASNDD
jgi:Zn-dependent M28 family amino/carboxypeptidase